MEFEVKPKSFFLLLGLSLCWGPSYPLIKFAIQELSPITVAAFRVTFAAPFLFLLCLCLRKEIRWKQMWKHYLFMGITLNVIPFSFIGYGEQFISSGLAAILICMTPIFTCLIAHFLYEPLTKRKFLGIFISFIGIFIVYFPSLFHEKMSKGGKVGVLLLLLAALSYAVGTVYARYFFKNVHRLTGTATQLLFASAILLPISFVFEKPFIPSLPTIWSILALGVLGTSLAFYFYYELIKISGPTFASLNSFITPVVSIILAWIFLSERLNWNAYLGGAFVFIGIALIVSKRITRLFSK